MDSVAIGAFLTVIGAVIVFGFLAIRLRKLMNEKPGDKK